MLSTISALHHICSPSYMFSIISVLHLICSPPYVHSTISVVQHICCPPYNLRLSWKKTPVPSHLSVTSFHTIDCKRVGWEEDNQHWMHISIELSNRNCQGDVCFVMCLIKPPFHFVLTSRRSKTHGSIICGQRSPPYPGIREKATSMAEKQRHHRM